MCILNFWEIFYLWDACLMCTKKDYLPLTTALRCDKNGTMIVCWRQEDFCVPFIMARLWFQNYYRWITYNLEICFNIKYLYFIFAHCVLRKTDLPSTKCVRCDKWRRWRDERKLDDKQIFVYAQKLITMNVSWAKISLCASTSWLRKDFCCWMNR